MENIAKGLRYIPVTPTLSKVAEHFIVHEHVKPAVLTDKEKTNTTNVVKLLGLYIQADLMWNSHIAEMV